MTHNCNQVDEFNNIKKQIAGVKLDLDQHRLIQRETETEKLVYREKREKEEKEQKESISTLALKIDTFKHDEPSKDTLIITRSLKEGQDKLEDALNEHVEKQKIHESKIDKFILEMISLKNTVDKKLLPVYDQGERSRIADEVNRERARSFKFWASVLASLIGFVATVAWLLHQLDKK